MYFKIFFDHNLRAKTEKERKKITGIIIKHGYYCLISYKCPNGKKCKYRKAFVFHNWSVRVHRFFQYHLKIKLPHLIYIGKFSTDLSGTITCPYKIPREENCYRCKYSGVGEDCENKERLKLWKEGKHKEYEIPENPYICKFFEKNDYFDCYNKKTGDIDYDSFIDIGMQNYNKNNKEDK